MNSLILYKMKKINWNKHYTKRSSLKTSEADLNTACEGKLSHGATTVKSLSWVKTRLFVTSAKNLK